MLVDMITQRSDNNLNLKDSMQKFSAVENVAVAEDPDEQQIINFDGERYATALPFKSFYKQLPDNYTKSKHRLSIEIETR